MILWEYVAFVVWGVLMPSHVGGRAASHPLPISDGPLPKTLLLHEILSRHSLPPGSIYNSNWNPPFQKRFPELYFAGLIHKLKERKRNRVIYEKLQKLNDYEGKRGHSLLHFGKRNFDEKVKLDHKQGDFQSLPRSLPEAVGLLYVILNKINSLLYQPYQREDQKRDEGHKMLYFGKRSILKPKIKKYFMNFDPNSFEGSLLEIIKNEDLKKNLINAKQPDRNVYFDKNQNDKKRPDHHMMYFGKRAEKEKQPDHHMIYFGKRLDKEKRPDHHMMYFGKRFHEQKQPDHYMMYFGKRFDEEKRPDHHMMYFGKRLHIQKRPDHQMMYFGKRFHEQKQPDHYMMYLRKRLNKEKRPDHQMMYFGKRIDDEKRPDHQMMYFGKRTEDKNRPDHQMMYFGKRTEDEKRPDHQMMYFGKRTEDEKRPDHQMMYFGKRSSDEKRPNHQMMYFGKRTEDEKRLDHEMMYFGKRAEKEKRPDHQMMYFGKRLEKEKRPDHRMMYFGKRSTQQPLHNHRMMYFGKRVDKDKPSEKQTVYFSKKPLSEIQPDDEMVYFGITFDDENQPDLRMVNFGKMLNEEKRADHKMIHFGKRPIYGNDEEEKFEGLRKSLYKKDGHNMLYFGKRMKNSENLESLMNSLVYLYDQPVISTDERYNSNDRSLSNHDISTSNNQGLVSHDMEQTEQPSLIHGNIDEKDNLTRTNLEVIPKVMKLLKGYETSAENNFHLTKRLETRSVNNEETNNVQSKQNKYLISAEHLGLAVKGSPNNGNSNTGKIVTSEDQKASNHKRVKRSTPNPDGTVADVMNDFTGYEFMPYNEEEDLISKKWSFENPELFPTRSAGPLVPVLTEQIQEQYPNPQYYFREDRGTNRKDEERNAFLHFG
ncbi:uncharacterized protein LOC111086420 [Limulus polyphemus]|uniref:Uncharacterized protein LOC111086420 n=1 Tax=Limulus polyphemus TaxID=6850 RepID=A0ABM1SMM3_LIMPO|nr:uncharacterized protein LOC111086420 [Limulus polyphemus]